MARKLQPLDAIVKRLENVPREIVDEIVELSNEQATESVTAEIGHSTFRGYRLRVVIDRVRTTDHSSNIIIRGTPSGFWQWLESGVEGHRIPRAGRDPRRAMPIGGDRFASGGVEHPGVDKWSGAWTRAVAGVDDGLPKILTSAVTKAVGR